MTNTALNRTVIIQLTNRSGGSVARGDVVIISSSFASSFETTATAAYSNTGTGVVLEPNGILNGAIGAVAVIGYVPKVNLNTAASIGDYIQTSGSAKGASPHTGPLLPGDFGEVLESGASPAATLFSVIPLVASAIPFSASDPLDVGSGTDVGTSGSTSRSDHVHRGVTGIYVAPNADIYGSVALIGSDNISVAQSSGSFTFSSSGSFLPQVHDINGQYHNGDPLRVTNGGLGSVIVPASGAIPIGTSGGAYAPNNITAGSNITIANSSGSITISSSGGGDFLVMQVFL